jgi:hypothetical protein
MAGCTTFYGVTPDATSSSGTGAGGSGGSAPGRLGLLPLLDAAHLCSLVASCPSLGDSVIASTGLPLVAPAMSDTRKYSSCVDWLTLPLATVEGQAPARAGFGELSSMIDCMAASSTCADAAKCAFIEALSPGDPVCSGSTGTKCDGADLLDCDARTRAHCGSKGFPPGSQCAPSSVDGSAACAVGGCGAAEVSCDPDVDPGPENASYVFACGASDLREGVDCRAFGLVCDEMSPTLSLRGCVGVTGVATCSTFGVESCTGAKVRVCSGQLEAEIDCGAIDRGCTTQGASARCEPSGPKCSPYDPDVNLCSGSSIRLCLDGAPTDFDCASIGMTCVPESGAVSGHCG